MPTNHQIIKGLDESYWNRNEVAQILGVTPARVSQIAKQMKIKPRMRKVVMPMAHYRDSDVARMKKRNTKPGLRK